MVSLLGKGNMPYPLLNQYGAYQPTYPIQQQYQQQFAQSQLPQQPIHGFVRVAGFEGAKAYQMPPNSEMPLFDLESDTLFIKTTDGTGFPTIKVCDVTQRQQESGQPTQEYMTRAEVGSMYQDLASQIEQMRGVINGLVPNAAAAAQPNAGENVTASTNDGWKPTAAG